MNQVEGKVNYMDHPEGHDQKIKGAPQYEAPKLEQSMQQNNQLEGEVSYMDHPESLDQKFKGASQLKTPKTDHFKKQKNQHEGEVGYMDHFEGHDKKFKGVPKHKTREPDQSKKQMNEFKGLDSISRNNIPGNKKKSEDSSNRLSATSQYQGNKGEIAQKKKHFWSNWAFIGDASEATTPKQPYERLQEHIEVKVDEVDTGPAESTPSLMHRETLEILKSIVYGGLIESLASLSVVTSAASADATTLNIVALAIANLIGGLFLLAHNLHELISEQVDGYTELLGQRKNFILHAFIAIISFIVFGSVAPVVYGFSFHGSDDKDFKLAAVAGASLLCITMLSIAKAYIKRTNNYFTYFKTVLYYISTGAVASLLSYLAGCLVKKLFEKIGWFGSASNSPLQLPGIDSWREK